MNNHKQLSSAAELTDSIENKFKTNLLFQYTIGLHVNDLKPTTSYNLIFLITDKNQTN